MAPRKSRTTAAAALAVQAATAELPTSSAAMMADPAPRGSRRGSPNRNYETAESGPSRCPKCGSTRRTKYDRKVEVERDTDPDGNPCTHAVLRYTQCLEPGCGQHRIDRSFENRRGKVGRLTDAL